MQSKLQIIQEFSIRLYLDQQFCNSYRDEKENLMTSYKLTSIEEHLFPNVLSPSFKSESYGRKFLIAKELHSQFKNFFCTHFYKLNCTVAEIVESAIFIDFLQSKEFYSKLYCFPHYAGIGSGHENVSKFYFFAIKTLLRRDELFSLKLDIGLVLNSLASLTDLAFYQPFKDVTWFNFDEDVVIITKGKWIRIKGDWNQSLNGNISTVCNGELQ